MAIEGPLRELTIQDVFQLLHLSRKTGELALTREPSGDRASVWFQSGAVVGARVHGAVRQLGHLILMAGKATETDIQRALELQAKNPGMRWGEALVQLGVVEESEMEQFVQFQIEEVVYQLLEWRDGYFSFQERPLQEAEMITWIPTESLLMEGARRTDERSALPVAVEDLTWVPQLSSAGGDGVLDLSPLEWEVLAAVDGRRDINAIAWELGRSEPEVSKVVAQLAKASLLDVAPPAADMNRAPHEEALDRVDEFVRQRRYEDARRLLETLEQQYPEEADVFLRKGILARLRGDSKGSVEALEQALRLDPLLERARYEVGFLRLKGGDLAGAAHEWTAYLRIASDGPERRRVERAMSAVRELQSLMQEGAPVAT